MRRYEIGIYGLGVMGSSLAKNMISHGFWVAAYSKDRGEREKFATEEENTLVCNSAAELIACLESPRIVFLMITAGKPVDCVLEELSSYLEPGDVVIDGGNSYYKDTTRRFQECQRKGICFLGVGVSGGEKGALNGPSMMAGGSLEAWEKTKHILQTIAAHAGETPCCQYIAKDGAGHYVKMVHNGIEYGILQLISEIYYFMKYILSMSETEILSVFEKWKCGKLDSYLLDISICVLKKKDDDGRPLVEKILDVAEQKGTGKWTLMESVDRGVYIPTIYEAVLARNFSAKKRLRKLGNECLYTSGEKITIVHPEKLLGKALLMGIILCYSQGMELIATASEEEQWEIDPGTLADVWREGCIIRSKLLSEVKSARVSKEQPLLLSGTFSYIKELEPSLRETVRLIAKAGAFLPGLAGALHYYDAYRMEQMPVNFIQALRDCFGAHTYRRTDADGCYHTEWERE